MQPNFFLSEDIAVKSVKSKLNKKKRLTGLIIDHMYINMNKCTYLLIKKNIIGILPQHTSLVSKHCGVLEVNSLYLKTEDLFINNFYTIE